MPIKKTIEDIVRRLNSDDVESISSGVDDLHALLKSMAPSIQRSHSSGSIDSRLATFVSLQENFQYNICSELIPAYQSFAGASSERCAATVNRMNTALMGLLLVHPESRNVFSKAANMSLILSFLDPSSGCFDLETCSTFVSLLIHILLRNLRNLRVFEACGGCSTLIRLLSLSPEHEGGADGVAEQQQRLHFKVVEFLIFYMTDETELKDGATPIRTISEKIGFIKPEFPAIEDLIDNLNNLSVSKADALVGY